MVRAVTLYKAARSEAWRAQCLTQLIHQEADKLHSHLDTAAATLLPKHTLDAKREGVKARYLLCKVRLATYTSQSRAMQE
eukprot:2631001-Amphidinium_carterae.1